MSYASQVVAMLVGGLVPSLGLTYLARSARGRAWLNRTRGRTLALVGVLVAVGCAAAVYFVARSVLSSGGGTASGGMGLTLPSASTMLAFGFAVGLFLAVPGAFLAWMDERARARERSKRRDHVPTKEDRRAFAADLARQISELSVPRRDVVVRVGGDGERVLVIEGPLEADEGEKLTVALRSDLEDLGFKRVEGSGGRKEWWSRV